MVERTIYSTLYSTVQSNIIKAAKDVRTTKKKILKVTQPQQKLRGSATAGQNNP